MSLGIRENMRWSNYVGRLETEPGIIITAEGKKGGTFRLSGLRDPLSRDPSDILMETGIAPETVVSNWRYYLDLHPDFINVRAEHVLNPPIGVDFSVRSGKLIISGIASHAWIADALPRASTIAGISDIDRTDLADADFTTLEKRAANIERQHLFFPLGSVDASPGQDETLELLVNEIACIYSLAALFDDGTYIVITGHTDRVGPEQRNMELSLQRAERIKAYFIDHGISPSFIQTTGASSTMPIVYHSDDTPRKENRRVSFKIHMPHE